MTDHPREAQPGGSHGTAAYTELARDPSSTALVKDLRLSELTTISDRLNRLSRWPWARPWVALGSLFFGGVIGGLIGLIPFLESDPSRHAADLYRMSVAAAAVLSLVFFAAGLTTQKERSDSTFDIAADLGKILAAYQDPSKRASSESGGGRYVEARQ